MNRFSKGIVVGAGFAVGAISILIMVRLIGPVILSKSSQRPKSIVETELAIINTQRLVLIQGRPTILGSISNLTNRTIETIIIQGSLFNRTGTLLNKETDYINQVSPNEVFNFKIAFPCNVESDGNTCIITIGDTVVRSREELSYNVKITQGYFKK
jgi:hypothetical protein